MSYVHTQPTPVERTRRRGLGGGGLHSRELFLVLGLASLIDQHVENENLS